MDNIIRKKALEVNRVLGTSRLKVKDKRSLLNKASLVQCAAKEKQRLQKEQASRQRSSL